MACCSMKTAVRILAIALFFSVFAGTWLSPISVAGPNKEAQEAFQSGNFERAVQLLVPELRKKNDHQDNIQLMETVLPLAYNKRLAEAQEAESRNDWDQAYASYQAIVTLNSAIAGLPPVMKETKVNDKKQKGPLTFQQTDVKSAMDAAKKNAIETHYAKGLEFQNSRSFKNAAVEYRQARQYDRNYQDAAARYDSCRAAATLKIAIMPFENKSGKPQLDPYAELLCEQIISNAMNSNPEFLQFVTRDYLAQIMAEQGAGQTGAVDEASAARIGKIAGVHAFVFGKVINSTQNFGAEKKNSGRSTRKVYQNKQLVEIYGDWVSHELDGNVTLTASYKVVLVETGLIADSKTVTEEAKDKVGWVELTGGVMEAIGDDVRDLNTPGGQRAIKNADELLSECANKLSTELASAFVEAYK
jgi:hypothetical protein